ncbi:ABC transporter ATP-binding protein [Marivivens aquimaris]|uniref:ABC transporter ATP-binding protein n=1 Tax=Marivivens aquimaris TaxID=2774876 RepID=UPI002AD20943|nr:ABC transporter ATP-binding protein [Marivivens aquimaris]
MLKIRDLQKSYVSAGQTVQVLKGVSLDLAGGETLALTGESGSGKSTLLHLAAGLDVVDAGDVFVGETNVGQLDEAGRAHLRRDVVGVIFQQFNLIPSLTVEANIAFHARLAGKYDADWCQRLADRIGLTEQLGKYPEQLSGGQQQRVAIARTLAARPALVLADEPTGNLDEETAVQVIALMLELVSETGAALLMVTHSSALAAMLDRRLHLRAGQVA